MFAITRTTASRVAGRRFASSTAAPKKPTMGGTEVWLSDPGAYPVIAILIGACTGCSAYMVHHFFTCADVRMDRTKRQSLIRTWSS
eukprot:CAMPEP_0195329140 /NCGR_PEP_ID=MMETSP0708-20121125/11251_1 /TAXON_ID=33640 /ORGANISM="Asterionellopsis glacialis, Strain CCMP134" /LENGTH=85 /DNA_ID=CAMNT_0040397143 /DNA_START=40 /DNA_END=297 /DNA_ORIENTATION=+